MNPEKEYKVFIPEEIPIKIRRPVQPPLDLHWHEFNELVIVRRGTGLHFTGKEEYRISAGDVFFIKPGELHGYRNTEKLELINILYFSEKAVPLLKTLKSCAGYRALFELEPEMREREGFKNKLALSPDELIEVEFTVKRIEEHLEKSTPYGSFTAITYLLQLIAALSKLYENIPDKSPLPLMRLGNILSYLENNYMEKISLDELVKRFHISKSTLIRTLKKISGTTPHDYLIKIRISRAAELLKNHDCTVSEAAMSSGFTDSNYFSRQFKKNTGISPREFKEKFSHR